jgi:two-component system phosphate regulon sensor histidine kinase PhoR
MLAMGRRPLGFRVKLLASYLTLVVLAAGIGLVVLDQVLGAELESRVERRLEVQVHAVGDWVRVAGRPERLAVKLASVVDARVVILDRRGEVIGDSAPGDGVLVDLAPDARNLAIGSTRLAVRASTSGLRYVTAIGPVDLDRIVALAVPRASIDEPRAALRGWLGLIAGAGFAVAVVLGLIVTQIVARPLRHMVASANRVGAGDYRIGPPLDSPDELGLLSRTLVSLADQVQGRIADVERERDFLGAVLSSLAEGVAVVDPAGKVRLTNPSGERILGAAVGQSLAQPSIDELVQVARSTGERAEREVEQGGRALAVTAVPLSSALDGAVIVVHDLTRVRRLETVRRDFVANLAHELRTPVTSIRGYAETLAAGVSDAATRDDFIAVIQRNAVRIGRLVDDLLVLQELDARPPDALEGEPIELADVAAEVARTLGPQASAAGLRLEIEVPSGLRVLADPDGLERILLNLVDNAVKYGAGGEQVRIVGREVGAGSAEGADELASGGATIELAVEDQGPGIPEGEREHVFERFFRLDAGRTRERGGTGLGLAIVRDLARSMGGRVRVEAATPRGARFVVTLRAADGGPGEGGPAISPDQ